MRPAEIDKRAFLAGYEIGRRLKLLNSPRTLYPFKQILIPDNYTVIVGEESVTLAFTKVSPGVTGVVLVPGLAHIKITADGEGDEFQYGVCSQAGTMPTIISTGAHRISFENGIPTEKVLTIADPTNMDCFFIGPVFSTPRGKTYTIQISWGGQPPPLDALITEEDDDVILTEDNLIIDAY